MDTPNDHVSAAELRAQLEAKKGSWQAVANDSGVSYSWLSKFTNGHIENPGHQTLLAIRDALNKAQPSSVTEA